MEKSEELERAEKKPAGDSLPVICDYTAPMNLAELYKQLRISTNRGYFGSQRVFSSEVFLIFLFLFFSWCFLMLSCIAEPDMAVRSPSAGKIKAHGQAQLHTVLSGQPFSLMEAQSKDCCNSSHICSCETKSLHTGFCRNTTGISAPCSGLSSFQWLQVTRKKSVCV